MPVDLRLQVQEHRAQADRRPVHEDKGARRRDAAEAAQVAMHVVDQVLPVGAGFRALLDHPGAVVEQRAVDKARPAVQHVDQLVRQIAEPPEAIRLDRQFAVVALQRVIEVDHALDEARRENPDAAEIEQIDGALAVVSGATV